MNILARPSEWTRTGARPASGTPFAGGPQHYFAFLSYSHKDEQMAKWLHEELEKFRVPTHLVGRITDHGAVPRRLTPIFRDVRELPASGDLGHEIKSAIAASQYLIVLCSPAAAASKWTNAEIEAFKRVRPEGCVLAAIVAGEPFASDTPGREHEECLPQALRFKYDRRGRPTAKRAEPLAADLSQEGEARRLGFLKLVAGMLAVGLDDLVQRDNIRRQRRLAWLAAASLAGMAVTSTLAITALQARDEARDQRRQAEGLVGFMLGDLKDKLEPIGRLDALDGVGARVLAYYQKQNTADLSDAAISQRSRALSLMGQVAQARGDLTSSRRLFQEAMSGTAEAIRRNPRDPQALFDHAQNVFYVGEIAHQRGDFRTAESNMREYQRLALRMVALGPDSMKWRMEKQYSDTNLGVILSDQRRFHEAAKQFRNALATMQAIATADPGNQDYQLSVAESLAWLADADRAIGNYREAIAARRQGIGTLEKLYRQTGDVDYQARLIPARRMLGLLYAEQGQSDRAIEQFRAAVDEADILLPKEPKNTRWVEYATDARIDLATQHLKLGNTDEAATQTGLVCRAARGLLSGDPKTGAWRALLTKCWELQAQVALARRANDQALSLAQRALQVAKTVHSSDTVADAYMVARAARLVGDIQRSLGDAPAARASWAAALGRLPAGAVEEPSQIAERALILRRLGRTAEASPLSERLAGMGYHHPIRSN